MRSQTPVPLTITNQTPTAARVSGSREQKAWRQAQEFEQVFLNTMLGQMFTGVGENSPLGGKHSEAWRGMLVDEYAKSITSQGGLGMTGHIYRELISAQEAAPRRLPSIPRPAYAP